MAAGLNSFGIAAGAGFGKALAEWVAAGEPPYDLWAVDVRRFGPHHNNKQYLFERTREAMGRHYLLPYPKWELVTGRYGRGRGGGEGERTSVTGREEDCVEWSSYWNTYSVFSTSP